MWVAGAMHVRTLERAVYASFREDVCSRGIRGFAILSRNLADLMLMAIG